MCLFEMTNKGMVVLFPLEVTQVGKDKIKVRTRREDDATSAAIVRRMTFGL